MFGLARLPTKNDGLENKNLFTMDKINGFLICLLKQLHNSTVPIILLQKGMLH
jgi:hypothetical protein